MCLPVSGPPPDSLQAYSLREADALARQHESVEELSVERKIICLFIYHWRGFSNSKAMERLRKIYLYFFIMYRIAMCYRRKGRCHFEWNCCSKNDENVSLFFCSCSAHDTLLSLYQSWIQAFFNIPACSWKNIREEKRGEGQEITRLFWWNFETVIVLNTVNQMRWNRSQT